MQLLPMTGVIKTVVTPVILTGYPGDYETNGFAFILEASNPVS